MFISGKAQECPNENKNSLWFNYPGCLYFGVFSLSLLSLSLSVTDMLLYAATAVQAICCLCTNEKNGLPYDTLLLSPEKLL